MDQIKPCPFCGEAGDANILEGLGSDEWGVVCEGCQAQGPPARVGCRDEDESKEPIDLECECIELWNKRS